MKILSTKAPFLPIYLMAILQGMAFTTLPAASNFITATSGLGLTVSKYGQLFLPMVLGSILSSFLAGILARRCGLKVLFLTFTLFNILAMSFFSSLAFFSLNTFAMLLVMMLFLGIGFGGMISCLNPFVLFYFPQKANSAITALHACLGIGTAIGPLLFSFFLKIDCWFLQPLLLASLFLGFSGMGYILLANPHSIVKDSAQIGKASQKNTALVVFAMIAFLYGLLETSFGNWGSLFLFQERNLSSSAANFTLATFWFFVTFGRVATAWVITKLPASKIYQGLPWILVGSLCLLTRIDSPLTSTFVFACAGLGCSAFLPLTISLASMRYISSASYVSGLLMAIYMIGYACASEIFPLLQKMYSISFAKVYNLDIFPAAILVALCFFVSSQKNKELM